MDKPRGFYPLTAGSNPAGDAKFMREETQDRKVETSALAAIKLTVRDLRDN